MKDLYSKISARANYLDPEMAKEFYFALIKVIVSSVKEDGEIQLPNLGTFFYAENKPKRIRNVITGQLQMTGVQKLLKFTPCPSLKAYIASMK